MTGKPEPTHSYGNTGGLSFEQVMEKCRYRTLCAPGRVPEKVTRYYTLIGHTNLDPIVLDQLERDVRDGQTFLLCAEFPDMLGKMMVVVDQLALLVAPPAGRA